MEKFSLINRNGVVNIKGKRTSNQCAKEGHEVYLYTLKVLFSRTVKLNNNRWIIDHQLLDDAVQKTVVDSCEIMSDSILNNVEEVLKKHKLTCIGIKLQFRPMFVVEENSAYFQEHRCHDVRDLPMIISL